MSGPLEIPKLFTVDEANQLLPLLELLIKELSLKKREIEDKQVEVDAVEIIMDEETPKLHAELEARALELNELVNQFNEIGKKIEDQGCLVKDIDQGLVDFFGRYEGEVVFFCWRLGEPRVAHWHEVGSGFANRKPLEAESKDHV